MRWVTTSARPIRVRIDEAHRLAAWTPADRERVIAALERWMATGIPVRFTVVPDGSEADLVVGWADHLPKGYSGWTSLQWDGSGAIMRGTVTLALLDTRDAPLPNRIRDAVVLHELGHALGLPHSSTPQALMWPVTSADAALTASDSIAVHELYNVDARPRAVTTR